MLRQSHKPVHRSSHHKGSQGGELARIIRGAKESPTPLITGVSTTIVYGPTFLKQNILSACRLPLCLCAKDRTAIS